MKAMILSNGELKLVNTPIPKPKSNEILVKVSCCGVCHTELDEIAGRIKTKQPVILGHQIIGKIVKKGNAVENFKTDDRVGIGWISSSCGKCQSCKEGNENLCLNFKATGCHVNGGYAEYISVSKDYAYKMPNNLSDTEASPLLCAGSIGYRSLKLANIKNGQNLGLTGFGASGHIVIQIVKELYPSTKVYVFARGGPQRNFAKKLGAHWTGDTADSSVKLDAIIDTTPVWKPVVEALKNLKHGGRLVINAIRKEDIDKIYLLNLDYQKHLWKEKEIKSVANITRKDIKEFLRIASKIKLKPKVQTYKLEEANKALLELRIGKVHGAKVLVISGDRESNPVT